MLEQIRNFVEIHLTPRTGGESADDREQRHNLAAAALMVELMQTDQRLDPRESEMFLQVMRDSFNLQARDLDVLCELARQEAKDATSLYQFTRLINDLYGYEEKVGLIKNMWKIAFADDDLDKYEESLIRQIAELIYVTHSDFIRCKLEVKPL